MILMHVRFTDNPRNKITDLQGAEGHMWAKTAYEFVGKNDWFLASLAYNQFQVCEPRVCKIQVNR